jgi:hypothetical protein
MGAVSFIENLHFHLMQAAAKVTVTPNVDGGPWSASFQKLLNLGAGLALLAGTASFLLGAALFGFGNRHQNYSQSANGKTLMLCSVVGMFAVGAAAAVVNFFYQSGTTVQ